MTTLKSGVSMPSSIVNTHAPIAMIAAVLALSIVSMSTISLRTAVSSVEVVANHTDRDARNARRNEYVAEQLQSHSQSSAGALAFTAASPIAIGGSPASA